MLHAATPPERLCILGHPVAHSLSPTFQNAALAAIGRTTRYERIDVRPADLPGVLTELARSGGAGNVTIPHKESVAAMASCSVLAKRVGAVNTFWHADGELIGHNTDVAGAAATIRALMPSGIENASCAIIGAGGSAAAVLVALHELGCRDIAVHSRTTIRAQRLADRLEIPVRIAQCAEDAADGAALIINATPTGMNDQQMPVDPHDLDPQATVFDLVYSRNVTAWVRACRAAGHVAEDGLRMLLEQGAAAFACWFGEPVPRAAMWSSVGRSWPDGGAA